jgi:hypothetical protein
LVSRFEGKSLCDDVWRNGSGVIVPRGIRCQARNVAHWHSLGSDMNCERGLPIKVPRQSETDVMSLLLTRSVRFRQATSERLKPKRSKVRTGSLKKSGTMINENAHKAFTAAICAALAVVGALGALYLPILLY